MLIQNRNGIIVDTELTPARGRAEEDAALLMVDRLRSPRRITLGGDKGYDDAPLIAELLGMGVAPYVAQNLKQPGGSVIDNRTTRHARCGVS